MGPMHCIVPVTITDTPDGLADLSTMMTPPVTIQSAAAAERAMPAIEIEISGGRRLRFEHDTDPAIIERLVTLLEGASR